MTRQQRLTIVAAVIGNGLEWYNFMLYGVFAAVIAHLYFPTRSGLTSLLLSLGTFGVGFFMRPVGGVLLGVYSDKVGRKQALAMTIMLMCIGTLLIAVTPTYATIGLAAPLLLVLARLLQGFSTGGEMGNATAYMRDYAPPERRAHFFSWVYASSGLFIGLGLAVGTIFSAIFSHDALYAWGWRIPFLLGLIIGPVGYIMRTRIPDPPVSQQTSQVEGRPLQHVLTHHLKELFATGALFVTSTICTYVLAVYTPVYTVHTLKLPQIDGFFATMLGTLIIGCLTPVVGHYVDRYGPKLFLRVSAALLIILAWPMFTYVNTSPSFGGLLVFQVVFAVVVAGYQGAILTGIGRMFPSHTLATGLSLADNIAVAVFGGSAAFIITSLIAITGSHMVPAVYLMIGSAVGLWGTTVIPGAAVRGTQAEMEAA